MDALNIKKTLHTLSSPAYLACDTTCLPSPDERSEVGAGDQTPGTTPESLRQRIGRYNMEYRIKPRPKRRVNMSIDEDVLDAMTATARELGCSRSQLVEYTYRIWATQNGHLDKLYSTRRDAHVS